MNMRKHSKTMGVYDVDPERPEISQRDGIGAKIRRLVSRRIFLSVAGSVAASLPFLRGRASEAAMQATKSAPASEEEPVTITKQGSFFVGGTSITAPGTFDPGKPNGPGSTYMVDHLYAQFQIPVNPRQYPIVMTHGSNQTGKTWESTPDGRDGFQTIFLRRGFSVYITDNPRRGRAGFPSFNGILGNLEGTQVVPDNTTRPSVQGAWVSWRLGPEYPNFYPNTAFPKSGLEQFLRQFVNNIGDYNVPGYPEIVSNAFVALLDRIGPAILMPHSMSGPYAMLTAIKSPKVKAIYAYEPAAYVYPKGEERPPIRRSDGSLYRTDTYELPVPEFEKLIKIPIHIVYGDDIPTAPDPVLGRDGRRCQALAAKQCVDAINRHGGDAAFVSLPELGLRGNDHFMFFDVNSIQVADLVSKFLHDKGLDKRI